MWPNPPFPADLVKFTEEILDGKLHFLCSEKNKNAGIRHKKWCIYTNNSFSDFFLCNIVSLTFEFSKEDFNTNFHNWFDSAYKYTANCFPWKFQKVIPVIIKNKF